MASKSNVRSRLIYYQNERLSYKLAAFLSRYQWLYRHLSDLLESTHNPLRMNGFLLLTVILLLTGVFCGSYLFYSLKGAGILASILAALPYLTLRTKLIGIQMKTRLDFLPAVEVFYQHYALESSPNIRVVLKNTLEGKRMMYPIKSVFEQLFRNLATNRETEDCLRIFALSIGHTWGDYFVSIIRFGLLEGVDVANNLKELITDMRKAQRADQAEKNRLLEIRLANFSPIVFLAIFMFINFKLNYNNAHYYYLVDAEGRDMLLDALLLIFASFIMGIYLSMKRM